MEVWYDTSLQVKKRQRTWAFLCREKSQASARDGMYSHNGSRSAPKMLASLLNRRKLVSQCLFNVGSRIHGMTPISSW
jgi:hypothetical protein